MRRVLTSIFLAFGLLFAAAPAVSAIDLFGQSCDGPQGAGTVCQEKQANSGSSISNNKVFGPNGIFTKVAQIITFVIGVAAVLMIMLGGIQYIRSDGESSKVNSARSTIIYAIVGIIVAAMAQSIIIFVLRRL